MNVQYFTNNKHQYKAIIKSDSYGGFFVKIGGKSYGDCINIGITQIKDNSYIGKISHIQSEPQCTYDSILDGGDTVPFVKASLQFCCELFPTLTIFKFDDCSNIECGKYKTNIPPRKMGKPLSLSHLSIATYGETWYERHFGAKMINSQSYNIYRKSIENLYTSPNIEYDEFKKENQFTVENDFIISKYYKPSCESWISFFNLVPKIERCNGFFNWLPFFIEEKINRTFNPNGWYIDINTMRKTKFKIILEPKGGYSNTRKNYQKKIIFKNSFDIGGLIFDGGNY